MRDPSHSRPRHPIGVVARRTGISPNLLRAWERRYAAITPGRTATGRRLYSDQDVARLALMRQALAAGHRIGEVAGLDLTRLESLIREDRQAGGGPGGRAGEPPAGGGPGDAPWRQEQATSPALLVESLAAVEELDRVRLERALAEGNIALGRQRLRSEVIAPLLEEIGRRWRDERLRIVHEHLASTVVRGFLMPRRRPDGLPSSSPRLVVATPAGQLHEFGALLAASAAEDHGWDAIYLGPNLPAEEIAAAVRRLEAPAVALSLVYPVDGPQLHEQLRELRRAVGPRVAILAGGRAAGASGQALLEIGAVTVPDAASLPAVLDSLDFSGS